MPLNTKTSISKSIEATMTSKGQVTLPKELRKRFGLQKGSRIRFSIPSRGAVRFEPVRYKIADLWRMADEGAKTEEVMSFDEMNKAKAQRKA